MSVVVVTAFPVPEHRAEVIAAFETALGSLKAQMKGPGVVLRSKTPDGVIQEVWALLCAYHAVRELISAAAALAAGDPLRICFVNALDVVRGPVGTPGSFPPSPR